MRLSHNIPFFFLKQQQQQHQQQQHIIMTTPTPTNPPTPLLTLHHLEDSQSLRVVWLLEELNVAYDIQLYKRDAVTKLAPPSLKAISPLGTSPCITTNAGIIALSETNAIIDYILDITSETDETTTHQLRPPPGSPDRVDYLFFFHGAQGSLGPTITINFIWKSVVEAVPCPISSLLNVIYGKVKETVTQPRIDAFLTECESKLTTRDFIASNQLTAADIVLIFPMEQVFELDPTMESKYPKCKAWVDRMHARPAHQRAVKKVGE
jgi:glutathione S-transferase